MEKPDLPVLVSSEDAISLIGKYLDKEWRLLTPQEVSVVRLQSGYNNSVYKVSTSKSLKKEPTNVIVRKYGGNLVTNKGSLSPCTEMEELIICCELGRQGLGPKVYGIIEGGRIEEFIENRLVTKNDLMDPTYETDLAINLARFHIVDVPLPRPKYNFIDLLRTARVNNRENIDALISDSQYKDIHHILSYDWFKEFDFLEPLLHEEKHRIVFMHWDTHMLNIGVRENGVPGQLKSFLFDYEMACYNIRGKDIGLYLLSKNGLISTDKQDRPLDEYSFPPDDECKHFVQEYSKESSKLFDDWDPEGKDSYEHIMMEALIGGMISTLCFMTAGIDCAESFAKVGPHFLNRMTLQLNHWYFECKKQLHTRYPDFKDKL